MSASRATTPAAVRWRPYGGVAVALTLLLGRVPAAHAGPTSLATAACARAIVKTGAAIAREQLADLGGCLDRTLQCLGTKPGDQGCLDRRRSSCIRTLHHLAGTERAAVGAIVDACEPASPNLLDVAGLGYALVADRCAAEFDAPLSDANTVAECVVREHHCGAMALLATQEPQAATILALAGVDAASIACLGDAAAAAASAPLASAVPYGCGNTARRAGRAFAVTRLRKLGQCAGTVVACGNDEACVTAAQPACDRAVAALPSAMTRLARSVDRACRDSATGTDAAPSCTVPDGGGGAAACLLQRDGCSIDDLLGFESPRGASLLSEVGIDTRGTLCAADTTAPTPAPTGVVAGATVGAGATATSVPAGAPTLAPTQTSARTTTPTSTPTRTSIPTRTPVPTATSTPLAVQALAIDSTATLRAGTDGGGIFASASGGDSWTPSSAGLTTLDVTAIVVDPTTSAVVYAGTDGGGVFTSASAGSSWTVSNAGLTNLHVRALAIDPAAPFTLFAGTGGSGIFRSDSGGASWTPVNSGLADRDVAALVIDPAVPTNLYAGTAGGGVFKSTDGGFNWTQTSLTNSFAGAAVVHSLAIDPVTTSVIYVGSDARGVFTSLDGGDTWTITSLFSAFPSAASVRALAVDPATPTTVFAGTDGGGVFVSQDGGATWTPTSLAGSFASGASVDALLIDPSSPATLYAGTLRGGVFKSTDGGATWSPARSGLPVG